MMSGNENPLLSLIIPIRDDEIRFVGGCLRDLEQQRIAGSIHVILAGPVNLIKKVQDIDTGSVQKEVIETDAGSLFTIWNEGIKHADTPLLSVIHPADRYRKDAFEQILTSFRKNNDVDLIYSDVLLTSEADETFDAHSSRNAIRFPDYDYATSLERGFAEIRPVWRKKLHDKHGYFDEGLTYAADLEFWLRIGRASVFHRLPEFLTLRYESPDMRRIASNRDRRAEFSLILSYYENNYCPANGLLSEKIRRLREIQRMPDGRGHLDELVKQDPSDQELWILLIHNLMQQNRFDEAKEVLSRALKKFPKELRLINKKAVQLWREGYANQAMKVLENAARDKPLELDIRVTLAEMYIESGNSTKAIRQLLYLIDRAQNNISLYTALITIFLEQKEMVRARYYYHLAAQKYPSSRELEKFLHLFTRPKTG